MIILYFSILSLKLNKVANNLYKCEIICAEMLHSPNKSPNFKTLA